MRSCLPQDISNSCLYFLRGWIFPTSTTGRISDKLRSQNSSWRHVPLLFNLHILFFVYYCHKPLVLRSQVPASLFAATFWDLWYPADYSDLVLEDVKCVLLLTLWLITLPSQKSPVTIFNGAFLILCLSLVLFWVISSHPSSCWFSSLGFSNNTVLLWAQWVFDLLGISPSNSAQQKMKDLFSHNIYNVAEPKAASVQFKQNFPAWFHASQC